MNSPRCIAAQNTCTFSAIRSENFVINTLESFGVALTVRTQGTFYVGTSQRTLRECDVSRMAWPVKDPGHESESRKPNGVRARAEAVPNRHKHGLRRSVAGSLAGGRRWVSAHLWLCPSGRSAIGTVAVDNRTGPVAADRTLRMSFQTTNHLRRSDLRALNARYRPLHLVIGHRSDVVRIVGQVWVPMTRRRSSLSAPCFRVGQV